VDFAWQNGQLASATIRSITGTQCKVRHGSHSATISLKPGQATTLNRELTALGDAPETP
jgi:hypothetical protein